MSGFQILLVVVAVNITVLGLAFLTLYQLNKTVGGRGL
jgi:hypothetical protein